MTRIYLIAFFLILTHFSGVAQDPSFSQFYQIGHWYNPSLAGNDEQEVKAGILYRRQWANDLNGYKTNAFNAEWAMRKIPFSLGLIILDDKAGNASLKTFNALLSGSYKQKLDRNQSLSAGMQIGFVQRSINMDGLKWDAQYNGFQYDPSLDNKEREFSNRTGSKFDLAAGVYYKMMKPFEVGVGYAFHHLGQDQTYLQNGRDRLPIRQSINIDFRKKFEKFGARVNALVQRQRGAMEYVVFGRGEYRFGYDSRYTTENNSSALYLGCGYRHGSAIIPTAGFEWQRKLEVGVSFDIVISKLNNATGFFGGPELVLIYRYRTDKRIRLR